MSLFLFSDLVYLNWTSEALRGRTGLFWRFYGQGCLLIEAASGIAAFEDVAFAGEITHKCTMGVLSAEVAAPSDHAAGAAKLVVAVGPDVVVIAARHDFASSS